MMKYTSIRWMGIFLLLSDFFQAFGFASETVKAHSIVYSVSDSQRFMTHWLMCGPLPNSATSFIFQATAHTDLSTGNSNVAIRQVVRQSVRNRQSQPDTLQQVRAFDFDFLTDFGGESGIQPQEGMILPFNGKEYKWQYFQSNKDTIDFFFLYGDKDYVVAYAYAEIESDQAKKIELALGSDDSIKAWLNGNLVHEEWNARQLNIDDDIIPIELQPGKNHLLLKIQNITREWSFVCRLIDPERPRNYQERRQNQEYSDQNASSSPDRFEEFVDRNPQVIVIIVIIMGLFFGLFFILFLLRKRLGL